MRQRSPSLAALFLLTLAACGDSGDDETAAASGSPTGGQGVGGAVSMGGGPGAGGSGIASGGNSQGGQPKGGNGQGGSGQGGNGQGGSAQGGNGQGGSGQGGNGQGGGVGAVEGALAACQHDAVTAQELLTAAAAEVVAIGDRRASVRKQIFGLADDGSVGPGSVTAIDWDPSHDSVYFSLVDPERNVPLLMPNGVGKGGDLPLLPLAVAGDNGPSRYVAFGANPLHDMARTGEPGGSGNEAMGKLVERAIRWLTSNDDPGGAGLDVVVAHLPDSYWFKHDATTATWLKTRFPGAKVAESDACESGKLAGCLATANLLIIGQDDGSEDDHGVAFDADAVMAAVEGAEAKGVPVLYLHYDGGVTPLGARLLSHLRLTTTDNYWRQALEKGFSPDALAAKDPTLEAFGQLVSTLRDGSLARADYDACIDDVSNVPACQAPALRQKLGDGLDALRAALGSLDEAAEPLCEKTGMTLLKLLVLLGDKYRAGDATTAPLAYPVSWQQDPMALARAAFADASVCYSRPTNPAQKHLGTFVCPRADVLSGACKGYDVAAVPKADGAIEERFHDGTEWTSTGLYALPGVAFTVKRTDGQPGRVALRINPHRVGSTRSLEEGDGVSNYDRPQFLASPAIHIEPGAQVVLSTPYGGAIYALSEGSPELAGKAFSLSLSGVARHAAVLDIGDDAQVSAFLADVASNPLPFVDIRGEGFEAHLRKDKFMAGAGAAPYNGDLDALFGDYRDHFVGAVYALAGFRVPGKTLEQTLSADVKAVCAASGWACTDDTLHVRTNIQHANYDQYANCGYGCSGNPFDAGWDLSPIGWGDSHELGHNLQMGALDIGWVEEADRNRHTAYERRAGENSNNIFPYHTLWRYERVVKGNDAELLDDHMNHRDLFAAAQSDRAGLKGQVGGATRKVIYDASCELQGDYDEGSAGNLSHAVWADGGYAADNGLRMSFYLTLPLMLHGRELASGVTLSHGFDLFTLLYLQARLFYRAAGDDTRWLAEREGLGFGALSREGDATYDGKSVRDMPGNDFLLISLSHLTGLDFRPYFDSRGVRYSDLAASQVEAHRASGRVTADAPTDALVLDTDLPGKDLSKVSWVPLDGSSPWPRDGFHPSTCMP